MKDSSNSTQQWRQNPFPGWRSLCGDVRWSFEGLDERSRVRGCCDLACASGPCLSGQCLVSEGEAAAATVVGGGGGWLKD